MRPLTTWLANFEGTQRTICQVIAGGGGDSSSVIFLFIIYKYILEFNIVFILVLNELSSEGNLYNK